MQPRMRQKIASPRFRKRELCDGCMGSTLSVDECILVRVLVAVLRDLHGCISQEYAIFPPSLRFITEGYDAAFRTRSEERRVGKGCRGRGARADWRRKR